MLRRAFKKELSRILDYLSIITNNIGELSTTHSMSFYVLPDIKKEDFDQVFLISETLSQFFENHKPILNIAYTGIFFGYLIKSKFNLSLEGSEFLFQNRFFKAQHIVCVNEKGEKKILYGNDLEKNMVIHQSTDILRSSFLLIINSYKEVLAMGELIVDFFETQNNDKVIARILTDKGYYLRVKQ